METKVERQAIKGGEFLIRETLPEEIFIPEEFSEEQKMMAQACQDFIDKEVFPYQDRIDSMEKGFMAGLLTKAGELGLLGVSIPEKYGGLGMSFNTSMLIADVIGSTGSFSTAQGAHTGIGTLPILYYGTEEQKQKYLPGLATGKLKTCYCLSEPDAGSDANAGKTKAILTEDGKFYLITGQKMWISNGGFADVLLVFAKIEDDKDLSAFILERSFDGITMNEEEKKMGIKGSSTRQIFFNDCKVPVENLLGERGQGFKIALNVLNIGRIKLGVAVIGACKHLISLSVNYGIERKQFGKSIVEFGAIQHKLAKMATKTYACESASYRAGQDIEDKIDALIEEGMDEQQAKLKGLEEFAIECAIIKVHGSEILDFAADEGVQIFGGMGYSAEAPMEMAYRDARICRIYEGTNEINRLMLVGILIKRAMKGELDVMSKAMAVGKELQSVPSFGNGQGGGLFTKEKETIKNLKKIILMVAGDAVQTLGVVMKDEQEILMNVADMLIEIYLAESTILRTEKLIALHGEEACESQINMSQLYLFEAVDKIAIAAKEALASFSSGDKQKVMLMGLKRFTKTELVNTKKLRRQIARKMIDNKGHAF